MKIIGMQIFLLVSLIQQYNCARILGLFPFQGRSHYVMFESIMKGLQLAEKGHEVDVLSHFPQKKPFPRFRDINVRGSLPILLNNFSYVDISAFNKFTFFNSMLTHFGYEICEPLFNNPEVQKLQTSKVKYDIIVTEIFSTDCFLPFKKIFNDIPVIALISSGMLPWANEWFGNPDNPSYIPSYIYSVLSRMNFIERFINTFATIYTKLLYKYTSLQKSNEIARKYFAIDFPPLEEMVRNFSLVLVNSHPSSNGARASSPNVIEVGGLHIKSVGKLDEKFEEVMRKKDIIYLSMGSMILTETLPKQTIKAMFEAFAELPYTIMWKGNKSAFSEPIPKNIHFEIWMPQLEILCHSNTKLFINHGGIMSTQESIYCGVPMIGIPFFGDQYINIQTLSRLGVINQLNVDEISKLSFSESLSDLLDNPSYKNNMIRLRTRFKDRPMKPLDEALWWIEYVLRQGDTSYLKPMLDELSWYQLYLFDVAAACIFILLLVCYVFYNIVKKSGKIKLKKL